MKSRLFITALIISITGSSYKQANVRNWDSWRQSPANSGIEYRTAFDHYNEFSAKEGKPANVWKVQIRNRYTTKKYVSWKIMDVGAQEPSDVHQARNVRGTCIDAGDYTESGLWSVNATGTGSVEVFIWPVTDCSY